MAHGVQVISAMSDAEREVALSTPEGRDRLTLRVVDPFMAERGYSIEGNTGLPRGAAKLDDEISQMSDEAQALVGRIFEAVDRGETGTELGASLAAVENTAQGINLSGEELTVVLSTSAIAAASSEYWSDLLQIDNSKVDTPEECLAQLAIADAAGAALGALLGGPGGAAAGAARASLVAYYDMLHTDRCSD